MLRIFTKNFGIKVLAVLIASSLWLYASANTTKADTFPGVIPIEPINLNDQLATVYDQDQVVIKIMADKQTWKELSIDDFSAYVDLKDLSIGTQEVMVRVSCSVPNVQITDINPNKILVRIEPVSIATVPVVVKTAGKPGQGYVVGAGQTDPSEVQMRGAKSLVQTINRATALVKLNGESADISKTVKLQAFDEQGKEYKNLSFSPSKVNLTLPISMESNGKTVGIKVKTKGSPAAGFWVSQITTNPATIDVIAPANILASTNFLETEEIDIGGSDRTIKRDVSLKLPDKVGFAKDQSNKVTVTLEINAESSTREIIAGFSYTGVGADLAVSQINPNQVKVLVSGDVATLQKLNSSNVVINIDLSGKATGSYFVSIANSMVSVPAGTAMVSYLPSGVTVNLAGK